MPKFFGRFIPKPGIVFFASQNDAVTVAQIFCDFVPLIDKCGAHALSLILRQNRQRGQSKNHGLTIF